MKKEKITESKGETYYIKGRGIPKGCKYCLKGEKAVLFLNGICQKPDHCSWYCPISEERRGKDITFIDEIKVSSREDLLDEFDKINAKGMSITGGEPLSEFNLEKTLNYINYVKSVYGKKFHVHLYTNGLNFNEKIANKLALAGLDEIRFHLPPNKCEKIKFALNKGYSVGAEVPIIPDEDYLNSLEKFILYIDKIGAEFINLNEFEICLPNSQSLKEKGYFLKKGTIASIINSKEAALILLKKLAPIVSIKIHFCSIRAKDFHQLKNRYSRRAKSIKLPYEEITKEGLLLFAQIEGKSENLSKLNEVLLSEFKIPKKFILKEQKTIKLPYYIAIEDQLIALLDEFKIEGYIMEITPFRQIIYQQITEKTPIKVYKQEVGLNEN